MIKIHAATFRMGSDAHYPEEGPSALVHVESFSIDAAPVTNAQFAEFVAATHYVTVAERPLDPTDYPGAPPENLVPGSLVFIPTAGPVDLRHLSQWWVWMPGASWEHPEGPSTGIDDRLDHPVVHVAHEDATTYAAWRSAALPTEAEWECAARGGLDGAEFTWGSEPRPDGVVMANTWDGSDFPWRRSADSVWMRTSPVGSFSANGFGLFDMAGNVWEWTDDWWSNRHLTHVTDAEGVDENASCCSPDRPPVGSVEGSYDPAQPQFPIARKVIKGGSHLCADTYCLRYRPAARRPQVIDTGTGHLGFRCVTRPFQLEEHS